jgi:hypothetical protein
MSILLDHLPTNFDVAFKRAMDSLSSKEEKGIETTADDNNNAASLESNKDSGRRPSFQDQLFESVAEIGLKGTTERIGGEGNVLGSSQGR